jgi:tetratricopeptide (TPR) repeat protein
MTPNNCCFRRWTNAAALLWLLLTALPATAQDAAQSMAFARQQLLLGNDSLARKTMQRVLFFDRKTYGAECYAALAYANLRLQDYAQSEFYFDLLYQNAPSDSVRYDALLGKAGALLLQAKYLRARLELLNLPTQLTPAWAARRHLYLGACYYGERKWADAERELLELIPADQPAKRAELSDLMRKARKYDRKNPKTARLLSIFIPGAGQLYAGDFKNGLNSLILNGLTATWFAYVAATVSFFDAGLLVGSWMFRYYAGGLQRTGAAVETKKRERLQRNFQRILPLLGPG